jgi:hypothetical protein
MNLSETANGINHFRLRLGVGITILGLVVYLLGVDPGLFGLDRSPVMGFVQIAVLLIGLAFMCLGGYITLNALWNGSQKSILADIGLRLVATGYLVAVASGMADILGFGNHPFPRIPYFGPLQAIGVIIGEVAIAVGFLMIIPYPRKR